MDLKICSNSTNQLCYFQVWYKLVSRVIKNMCKVSCGSWSSCLPQFDRKAFRSRGWTLFLLKVQQFSTILAELDIGEHCDWKGRKVMIRLGVFQQYLKLESSNPWLHWNEPEVHGAPSSCLFLNLFSVVIGTCWGSICQSKWFTWKPEFVGLELLHHRVACFICWHWTKSTELGNLHQSKHRWSFSGSK
jgi:hypothetical protein